MSDTTTAADDIVAYKNLNTAEIHLSDGPNPDLDARPNMERVSLAQVPPSVLDAARRAQTERASMVEAAKTKAAGGLTDTPPSGPIMTTGAHHNPPGLNDSAGILSRPGMRPGGADRETMLAADTRDRAYPDRRGVIARGEDDTGDNQELGPLVRGTLLPKAVTETPTDEGGDDQGGGSDPVLDPPPADPVVASAVEAPAPAPAPAPDPVVAPKKATKSTK